MVSRCHWYFDDGTPKQVDQRIGCDRKSKCFFIHPGEELWDAAKPPTNMPSWIAKAHKPISPPKWPRSSKRHSRSRSPGRERGSTTYRDRSRDSGYYRRDSTGARMEPPSPRAYRRVSSRSYDFLPTSPSRGRERTPTRDLPPESPRDTARIPSYLANKSTTSDPPPRSAKVPEVSLAQTAHTPTLWPPVSIPTSPPKPPLLQIERLNPQPPLQPPSEEIKAIWIKRIELITDGVASRMEQRKLDEELQDLRRWESAGVTDAIWSARIAEIEAEKAKKVASSESILKSLVETDYWPTYSQAALTHSETDHQNMVGMIRKLQDVIGALNTRIKSRSEPLSGDGHPTKRKRITSDEDEEMEDVTASPSLHTAEDDSSEINEVQDRLACIAAELSSLENRMNERDRDLTSEINDLVENAIHKYTRTNPHLLSEAEQANQQLLQEISAEGKTMDRDISEIKEEVAELSNKEEARRQQIDTLQKQLQFYAELPDKISNMGTQIDTLSKANEALKAALEIQARDQSQAIPAPEFPQGMIDTLDEYILGAVTTRVALVSESLRGDVGEQFKLRNEVLFGALAGKLKKILAAVEKIEHDLETGVL